MDLMLTDKVAMISGGSRGLGFHIAKDLVGEGCHVAISARGEERLEQAVDELNALGGGRAAGLAGDITEQGVPDAFLQRTLDAFGGVDILVNNVGGSNPKAFLDITDEEWREGFGFNLYHAVTLSRLVIPEMKKRGGGSILNVASIYGRESKGAMTYNASKAALISFSKGLAQQTAQDNIRVNSIAPGSIIFPGGVWERRVNEAPDGLKGFVDAEMPLGRFGRPEELSAVHGACWNVDGSQSRSNI